MARSARRPTVAAAALLLAGPVGAQSFGVGAGQLGALYPVGAQTARFDSDVYVAGFYGSGTYRHAFTGTDMQAGDSVSVRLFGADLAADGNATPLRTPDDLPVSRDAAVRLGGSYRSVDAKDARLGTSTTAQIGEGALGVRGGLALDAPPAMTAGLGMVTAEASYVASAGAAADLTPTEPEPFAVRAGTFSIGVRVQQVLRTSLGVSVGYTRRSSRRSATLESGGDFIEAVTGGGTLSDYETLNLVRVGIAF